MFQDLPTIQIKKGRHRRLGGDNRQPVIINDVYSDQRFYANVDRTPVLPPIPWCIPLQCGRTHYRRLAGHQQKSGDFNEHDLRLLQAIGGPLAAAIENARLHNDMIAEKRRVETIINNMSEGLLTVSSQGLISHANDALLSLIAQTPDNPIEPANKKIRLHSGSFEQFMRDVLNPQTEKIRSSPPTSIWTTAKKSLFC